MEWIQQARIMCSKEFRKFKLIMMQIQHDFDTCMQGKYAFAQENF